MDGMVWRVCSVVKGSGVRVRLVLVDDPLFVYQIIT